MSIFEFASYLLHTCKTAEPINNKSDYYRIKRWKNKTTVLYVLFTVVAVAITVFLLNNPSLFASLELEQPMNYIVIGFVSLLAAWGFATMLLNFKLLLRSMWSAGAEGYRTGEQIQTNTVNIIHEYGDRYRVTKSTENQGCAVALINGFINLFVWSFLCIYICPFLTFGKISKTKKNIRRYKLTQF